VTVYSDDPVSRLHRNVNSCRYLDDLGFDIEYGDREDVVHVHPASMLPRYRHDVEARRTSPISLRYGHYFTVLCSHDVEKLHRHELRM
jgi:hypothetical protein